MKSIITDWCNFCEGRALFDKDHFHTLFWEDNKNDKITKDELILIFKYFPNSKELFNLMNDYLFNKTLLKNATNETLIELVKKDINQKKLLSTKLQNIDNYPIEYIANFNLVEQYKNCTDHYEYYDEISDIIADNWIIEDKKTFALYESFYGLVNDYEIVWYLFSPLINTKINFKYYFDFTSLGGIHSINNKKILVSKN